MEGRAERVGGPPRAVMVQEIAERRRDYRDFHMHPKRRYGTRRRKPGTVWNWHGPVPWWGDMRQMIQLGYERRVR